MMKLNAILTRTNKKGELFGKVLATTSSKKHKLLRKFFKKNADSSDLCQYFQMDTLSLQAYVTRQMTTEGWVIRQLEQPAQNGESCQSY